MILYHAVTGALYIVYIIYEHNLRVRKNYCTPDFFVGTSNTIDLAGFYSLFKNITTAIIVTWLIVVTAKLSKTV